MTYDFTSRHDYLRKRMRKVNSRLVIYVIPEIGPFEVPATCYELTPEELSQYGVSLDVERRDYIIDVAEFNKGIAGSISGSSSAGPLKKEPDQGDTIIDGNLTCTVAPLLDTSFKYTTHGRKAVRIHTQVTEQRR